MLKQNNNYYLRLLTIFLCLFLITSCSKNQADKSLQVGQPGKEKISYYTCGMHPSVKMSPKEYKDGQVSCPICNMGLVPIYKESQDKSSHSQERVLFYRHPDNPSITSLSQYQGGEKFIPVYESNQGMAAFYGCGMQGAEHVFLIQDVSEMTCPVCGMDLIKLSKQDADQLVGVVARVNIKGQEAQLAGVKTHTVDKVNLYKEIRTVGKVAYDPDLAITEEEFISSLVALDKMKDSSIPEIKDRALNLLKSAKRKLKLLGLSDQQIKELEESRQVHTSLILPEEKMWIYGNVYEYELGWLKPQSKVKVTTSSFSGQEFFGIVASVNPVLDPKTRSVTFRAQVDNPDLKLKPQMYVDVVISTAYLSPRGELMVLGVPKRAVLDTGVRKIVWVQKSDGLYEGREVKVGPEAVTEVNGEKIKFYPVLKGLSQGDLIVTKANFLIDSQSQLSGSASSAYGGAIGQEEPKGSQTN